MFSLLSTHRRGRLRSAGAFTLIELLTATTVLALLMVVVVQMINSAASVTGGTTRHLDADSQARLAFDRMAIDFAQVVKRSDVDYYFVKKNNGGPTNPGNDQMAFYSESTGYYPSFVNGPVPKSGVTLVGYCINNCQLQRLNKALVWNGVQAGSTSGTNGQGTSSVMDSPRPMTFLPQTLPTIWPKAFVNSTNPDMSTSTEGDYQVVGESVFRMEVCYLVRNATTTAKLSDTPYLPTPTPSPAPSVAPGVLPYNALHDIAAVVVTLAVLDGTSQLIIPKDNRVTVLNAAASVLDDATGATVTNTPAKAWQQHIDNGDLVNAGLPRRAASQVRVYERYFYLGNTQ